MFKNENNALTSTMDVAIFDTDNNMVALLDSTQEVEVNMNATSCYIFIRKALYNIDLLKFIGWHEKKDDLSVYLDSKEKLSFGGSGGGLQCKVVTTTPMFNTNNELVREMKMEFPKAEVVNEFIVKGEIHSPSPFDVVIKASKFNEQGDFFYMHI